MDKLTIMFSGLSDYQTNFDQPLPSQLDILVNLDTLINQLQTRGKDDLVNSLIELICNQCPDIMTIIVDHAPVHYHGNNLLTDLQRGSLYLCAHERY